MKMSNKKVEEQNVVTIEIPKSLIEKIVNKYIEENINKKGEIYLDSERVLRITNKEINTFIDDTDF